MAVKQKEVFKWLSEVFKDSPLPEFKVNQENIDLLFNLMKSHTEAYDDVNLILEEYERKTQDYELHTHQLQNQLERIKMNESLIRKEDKKSFDALVDISLNVGFNSPKSSALNPAIFNLENECHKVSSALQSEKNKTRDLLKITHSLGNEITELKRIALHANNVKQLQNEEAENIEKKSKFYRDKISNYTDDIAKLEVKLEFAGFDSSLTQESVAMKWQELQELEKKLEDATSSLATFTLPPDVDAAQAKVVKARKILADSVKGIAQKY